jgi:hypothetical protein
MIGVGRRSNQIPMEPIELHQKEQDVLYERLGLTVSDGKVSCVRSPLVSVARALEISFKVKAMLCVSSGHTIRRDDYAAIGISPLR